jgi:hypothetical protein
MGGDDEKRGSIVQIDKVRTTKRKPLGSKPPDKKKR